MWGEGHVVNDKSILYGGFVAFYNYILYIVFVLFFNGIILSIS